MGWKPVFMAAATVIVLASCKTLDDGFGGNSGLGNNSGGAVSAPTVHVSAERKSGEGFDWDAVDQFLDTALQVLTIADVFVNGGTGSAGMTGPTAYTAPTPAPVSAPVQAVGRGANAGQCQQLYRAAVQCRNFYNNGGDPQHKACFNQYANAYKAYCR